MKSKTLMLCTFISLAGLWPLRSRAQFKAVPKPRSQNKPSASIPQLLAQPSYDQLLICYLNRIDDVTALSTKETLQRYRENLTLAKENDDSILSTEEQWLEKLRKVAQTRENKRIDFDEEEGHSLEFGAISSTSDASARIFSTLRQEGLVDRGRLIDQISGLRLSKGWIAILRDFVADANTSRSERREAILRLYKAGVDREKLRPELIRMATYENDLAALELLFFRGDPDTGRVTADISSDNLQRYKQLEKLERRPEMRVICAQYAAEIRDYESCQLICNALLNEKYKGLADVLAPAPEEDMSLYRARNKALQLMFYKIKNEWAFSVLCERGELNKTVVPIELADKDEHGRAQASFRAYSLGKMETEFAQSLIDEVRKWSHNETLK